MRITVDEVRKIAVLARLEFDEKSLESMARDLDNIVGYVEKLDELDVSEVPETAHVLQLTNVLREDKVQPWLTNAQALANAPVGKKGYFSVPKVIG